MRSTRALTAFAVACLLAVSAAANDIEVQALDGISPVSGADVTVKDSAGNVVRTGKTEGTGTPHVEFTDLEDGTYTIEVTYKDGSTTKTGTQTVTVSGSGDDTDVAVFLSEKKDGSASASTDENSSSAGGGNNFQVGLDVTGGYSSMNADTSATGEVVMQGTRQVQMQDPVFPDRFFTTTETFTFTDPFSVSGGSDLEGGFGNVLVSIAGPECEPCGGLRPVGGFTFYTNTIGNDGLDEREPLATTFASRYAVGGQFGVRTPIWRDVSAEGGLMYQNDQIDLDGEFNPKGSTEFDIHSLGPWFNVSKPLVKSGNWELGLVAGFAVLFPVGDRTHDLTLVTSNGSNVTFEFEAKTQWNVNAGVRVLFNTPGF